MSYLKFINKASGEAFPGIIDVGSLTDIYVNTLGNDDWPGTILQPYKTMAVALAAVTAIRKNIFVAPGTYVSAASLAWPTGVTDVLLSGMTEDPDSTIIECTSGTEVLDIVPSAAIGVSNFLAFMAGINLEGSDGVRGLTIDNTNMTASKKLIVTARDCSFSNDTDTDRSISWVHDANINAPIKMYMHGRGLGANNIEGLVYIDPRHSDDRCKVTGMHFEGGIQFGTATITSESEFLACIMKLGGGSGGQDTQELRVVGCVSRTGGPTYAAAALGDFADNAAEAFLSFT